MLHETSQRTKRGLYTATEIATLLSVEPQTIHNWAAAGKIPVALRTGKTIRFNLDEVTQALATATAKAQDDRVRKAELRRAEQEKGPWEELSDPRNSIG